MNGADLSHAATEALYLALLLSVPALAASLVIGLTMAVLQAVTQVQEQTLAFVPKLLGVGAALAAFGGLMGAELLRFTDRLFQSLPALFP